MPDVVEPSLLPIVVGGLIGITGSLATAWLAQGAQGERERRKQREEKFQELVAAVYELNHWVEKLRNANLYGKEDISELSPISKLSAIATVYFPQFEQQIRALDLATSEYVAWVYGEAGKRYRGEEYGQNSMIMYRPFYQKILDLLSNLRDYAEREFNVKQPTRPEGASPAGAFSPFTLGPCPPHQPPTAG